MRKTEMTFGSDYAIASASAVRNLDTNPESAAIASERMRYFDYDKDARKGVFAPVVHESGELRTVFDDSGEDRSLYHRRNSPRLPHPTEEGKWVECELHALRCAAMPWDEAAELRADHDAKMAEEIQRTRQLRTVRYATYKNLFAASDEIAARLSEVIGFEVKVETAHGYVVHPEDDEKPGGDRRIAHLPVFYLSDERGSWGSKLVEFWWRNEEGKDADGLPTLFRVLSAKINIGSTYNHSTGWRTVYALAERGVLGGKSLDEFLQAWGFDGDVLVEATS